MTALSFLCLLRDAGEGAWHLCADVAAVARPGDEVIVICDGGRGDPTGRVVGRYAGLVGWPTGLRVEQIVTRTRGAGDIGTALSLAIGMVQTPMCVVLTAGTRLGPGFTAARTAADQSAVVAPAVPVLRLEGLIWPRRLTEGFEVPQGEPIGADLALLHHLRSTTSEIKTQADMIIPGPWPDRLHPAWFDRVRRIRDRDPASAAWLETATVARMTALPPGGHAVAAPMMQAVFGKNRACFAAPEVNRRQPMTLCLRGAHARRMPFSYPDLASLWEGITLTDRAAQADMILYGHPRDLLEMDDTTAEAAQTTPLALMSEEPFWDSLFSPDPLAARITLPALHLNEAHLAQINHHTSAIFDFDRIPYFLLTEDHYAARYAQLFTRNAGLSPQDWEAAFGARALRAAFMAERRPEGFHDLLMAEGGITGLCAWRTRLAEGYDTGKVARLGASWGGAQTRFELEDWHADKIAQLDGQAQILSALENTHQPLYLSEKLFDAFALGARPLYWAEPAHRLHDMGLPDGAWINLAGLSSEEAPAVIDAAPWDRGFYTAYAQAQSQLAALWEDTDTIQAEKARLRRAVRAQFAQLLG